MKRFERLDVYLDDSPRAAAMNMAIEPSRAALGIECGIHGLVASPHEVKRLRQEFGSKIKIVTPGIRPNWSKAGDQKRVMAPREALDAGANYLVIGRPIVADPNPRKALAKILDELRLVCMRTRDAPEGVAPSCSLTDCLAPFAAQVCSSQAVRSPSGFATPALQDAH
jgi:hypothetical protein